MITSRCVFSRGIALLLGVSLVLRFGLTTAAPGDIFTMPAPGISAEAPKAKDIKAGDASVSTQTGALTFSYPLKVPPGRHIAPSLALTYSSQASTYGGIATGWSLDIPSIRFDTSRSILRYKYGGREAAQGAISAPLDDEFVSSLAGGRPLVRVIEPVEISDSNVLETFRARNDSAFLRYQRMKPEQAFRWRVMSPDGTTYLFGDPIRTSGCANISDGNAPLTSMVDSFGNEVSYHWGPAGVGLEQDCRIEEIRYGQNTNANVQPFATIKFAYSASPKCGGVPVGSQSSHRAGFKQLSGASRLDTITMMAHVPTAPGTAVSADHTRVYTLAYDSSVEACDRTHAPLRMLTSIDEKAWGTDAPLVDLPATTFEYAAAGVVLNQTSHPLAEPWAGSLSGRVTNLGWGYRYNDDRWPTVEVMFVDLDGDGLVDRLRNTSIPEQDGTCHAVWQRNTGNGFTGYNIIQLPRLKWGLAGAIGFSPSFNERPQANGYEGCSLNGQLSAYANSTGGTKQKTYLVYRWFDADGDGLTDLVTAVHGYEGVYDPYQGTVSGAPREPDLLGEWPLSCPTINRCKATSCSRVGPNDVDWLAVNQCVASALDRGCFEYMRTPGGSGTSEYDRIEPYSRCDGLYPWSIRRNVGNGVFAPPIITYRPVPLESDTGDSAIMGSAHASQKHAIADLDGDGINDSIVREGDWWWSVWLGKPDGSVDGTRYLFETRSPSNHIGGIGTQSETTGLSSTGMLDLDGDGLPEHWVAKTDANGNLHSNVAVNEGLRYGLSADNVGGYDTLSSTSMSPAPATPFAVKPGDDSIRSWQFGGKVGTFIREGHVHATNRVIDVDHDGRPDVVTIPPTGSPAVYLNAGGQFLPPVQGVTGGPAIDRRAFGNDELPSAIEGKTDLTWELQRDHIDLDGDGIMEAVQWIPGPGGIGLTFEIVKHTVAQGPPRLLKKISNGRGAHTLIEYDSMHSPTVVQAPSEIWFDGRPKTSPSRLWVVKSVSLDDKRGFALSGDGVKAAIATA